MSKRVKEIIIENKNCKKVNLINYHTKNLYLSAPLYKIESLPNLNYFEELTTGYYSQRVAGKVEIENNHITIYTY